MPEAIISAPAQKIRQRVALRKSLAKGQRDPRLTEPDILGCLCWNNDVAVADADGDGDLDVLSG